MFAAALVIYQPSKESGVNFPAGTQWDCYPAYNRRHSEHMTIAACFENLRSVEMY